MKVIKLLKTCLIVICIMEVSSCQETFKEEDKIFHGAPESLGIGGLSFALYRDNRYQVMNSGGIGWFEYSGSYILNGDTITLNKLDKESNLENNRLIIYRYNKQDSAYWKWKYSDKLGNTDKTLGSWSWQSFKDQDKILGEGDVYQLDENNKPLKNKYHFFIRLDSLNNYR
jgi:hypothetical protein